MGRTNAWGTWGFLIGVALLLVGIAATSLDLPGLPGSGSGSGGWVESGATEAVSRDELLRRAKPSTHCSEGEADLIAMAKGVAGAFEAYARDATRIEDKEERQIGGLAKRGVSAQFARDGMAVDPPGRAKERAYLTALMQHLLGAVDHRALDYTAHVLEGNLVNAFAIPGGDLYVTTGMLRAVRSEAELAAVLAHEIGHVEARHTVAAWQYAKALVPGNDYAAIAAKLLVLPMSSEYEHEADRLGTERVEAAQYDPLAVAGFWSRLAQKEGEIGDPIGDVFEQVLGSHPKSTVRCVRTWNSAQRALERGAFERYYVGVWNVQHLEIGPETQR